MEVNKMNYNEEMKKIIKNLNGHNKLLLHSCCGPCSSAVIERLKPYFDITILYYNPNIEPKEEYEKRKSEQLRLLKELNIKYMDIDYLNEDFHEAVIGYEQEKENGARCPICYKLRLEKTCALAKEKGYDYFGTTLTVSPHKNSIIINKIGLDLEAKYNIKFLLSDFKKEDGYKRSIELSKEYNLYRQNYCGCLYSKGANNEE
jgi:predicted adenine nucleotide alpha hydrolase (AANH) superfamily ATPase